MSYLKTQRYQLIDVTLPAGFAGNTINIPDQPMLRHKRVQAIEIFLAQDFPLSPITGNAVTTLTQAQAASITLYTADPIAENDTGEYVYRLPLLRLHNIVNSSADPYQNIPYYLDDVALQWEKCSLTFQNLVAAIVPTSILIGVYYTSMKERNMRLTGKKISGVDDGSILEILMAKIMSLEKRIADMFKNNK